MHLQSEMLTLVPRIRTILLDHLIRENENKNKRKFQAILIKMDAREINTHQKFQTQNVEHASFSNSSWKKQKKNKRRNKEITPSICNLKKRIEKKEEKRGLYIKRDGE